MINHMERQRVLYIAKTKTAKVIQPTHRTHSFSVTSPSTSTSKEYQAPLASVDLDMALVNNREDRINKSFISYQQSRKTTPDENVRVFNTYVKPRGITHYTAHNQQQDLTGNQQMNWIPSGQLSHDQLSTEYNLSSDKLKACTLINTSKHFHQEESSENMANNVVYSRRRMDKKTHRNTQHNMEFMESRHNDCATETHLTTITPPLVLPKPKNVFPVSTNSNSHSTISENCSQDMSAYLPASPDVSLKGYTTSQEYHIDSSNNLYVKISKNTSQTCNKRVATYCKPGWNSFNSHDKRSNSSVQTQSKHEPTNFDNSNKKDYVSGLLPEMMSPYKFLHTDADLLPEMYSTSPDELSNSTYKTSSFHSSCTPPSNRNNSTPLVSIDTRVDAPLHHHTADNSHNVQYTDRYTSSAQYLLDNECEHGHSIDANTHQSIDEHSTDITLSELLPEENTDLFSVSEFKPRWKRNSMRLATQGYTSMSDLAQSLECIAGHEGDVTPTEHSQSSYGVIGNDDRNNEGVYTDDFCPDQLESLIWNTKSGTNQEEDHSFQYVSTHTPSLVEHSSDSSHTSSQDEHSFHSVYPYTNTHEKHSFDNSHTNSHDEHSFDSSHTNPHQTRNFDKVYSHTNPHEDHSFDSSHTNPHEEHNFHSSHTNPHKEHSFDSSHTNPHEEHSFDSSHTNPHQEHSFDSSHTNPHQEHSFDSSHTNPHQEHSFDSSHTNPHQEHSFDSAHTNIHHEHIFDNVHEHIKETNALHIYNETLNMNIHQEQSLNKSERNGIKRLSYIMATSSNTDLSTLEDNLPGYFDNSYKTSSTNNKDNNFVNNRMKSPEMKCPDNVDKTSSQLLISDNTKQHQRYTQDEEYISKIKRLSFTLATSSISDLTFPDVEFDISKDNYILNHKNKHKLDVIGYVMESTHPNIFHTTDSQHEQQKKGSCSSSGRHSSFGSVYSFQSIDIDKFKSRKDKMVSETTHQSRYNTGESVLTNVSDSSTNSDNNVSSDTSFYCTASSDNSFITTDDTPLSSLHLHDAQRRSHRLSPNEQRQNSNVVPSSDRKPQILPSQNRRTSRLSTQEQKIHRLSLQDQNSHRLSEQEQKIHRLSLQDQNSHILSEQEQKLHRLSLQDQTLHTMSSQEQTLSVKDQRSQTHPSQSQMSYEQSSHDERSHRPHDPRLSKPQSRDQSSPMLSLHEQMPSRLSSHDQMTSRLSSHDYRPPRPSPHDQPHRQHDHRSSYPQDQRSQRTHDQRSSRPHDQMSSRPHDQRSSQPNEPGSSRPHDQRSSRPPDQRTSQPYEMRSHSPYGQRSPRPHDKRLSESQDKKPPRPQDQRSPRPQDQRSPRPQDQRSPRPQDQRSPRPQDQRLPRPQDQRLPRPQDQRLPRPQDQRLPRPQDQRLPRPHDKRLSEPQEQRPPRPQDQRLPRPHDKRLSEPQEQRPPRSQDQILPRSQDQILHRSQDQILPRLQDQILPRSQDQRPYELYDQTSSKPHDRISPKQQSQRSPKLSPQDHKSTSLLPPSQLSPRHSPQDQNLIKLSLHDSKERKLLSQDQVQEHSHNILEQNFNRDYSNHKVHSLPNNDKSLKHSGAITNVLQCYGCGMNDRCSAQAQSLWSINNSLLAPYTSRNGQTNNKTREMYIGDFTRHASGHSSERVNVKHHDNIQRQLPAQIRTFIERDVSFQDESSLTSGIASTSLSSLNLTWELAPRFPPSLGRPRRKLYAGFDSQPLPMDNCLSDTSSVYSMQSSGSWGASRSAEVERSSRTVNMSPKIRAVSSIVSGTYTHPMTSISQDDVFNLFTYAGKSSSLRENIHNLYLDDSLKNGSYSKTFSNESLESFLSDDTMVGTEHHVKDCLSVDFTKSCRDSVLSSEGIYNRADSRGSEKITNERRDFNKCNNGVEFRPRLSNNNNVFVEGNIVNSKQECRTEKCQNYGEKFCASSNSSLEVFSFPADRSLS